MKPLLRMWCSLAGLFLWLVGASLAHADKANVKALTEALQKFTLPEMPAELKQQLRDYVPNDLKRRREEANAKSTLEWRAIDNKEEWEAFRKEKLKKLQHSLGLSFQKDDWKPPQLTEPPVNAGTIKGEGYRIDKLIYRSSYGQWITANLYVPEPAREKMPGFIISHAHHTPKEHGELQDMGVLWARAGCYVLVPDHLGHGERRQHPFASKDDYDKPFQVSRQDYYFRYDVNLQLNIVGESLMGCLALDLMTGVSLLHSLPKIDKDKIIMLGAVAGGGDPCAVAAALDERVTCAAPFNFGGPQPETRYPIETDEAKFNYGGSGGWESTRNLAYSYRDGFLPWVIVGSIAPRRLIYGHEFSWDREHDPVWKRFQSIYGWYGQPDHLSSTHGFGTLTSKDPPGSHCTHIGKVHRKSMHEALAQWFDIKLPGGEESTDRHETAELRCWTQELRAKLKPMPLFTTLASKWSLAKGAKSPELLDGAAGSKVEWQSDEIDLSLARARQYVLVRKGRMVPMIVIEPKSAPAKKKPGVLVIARASKQDFINARAEIVAQFLDQGISVALPDLYSSGLTGGGTDLGRRSSATGRASTLAMFGTTLSEEQASDASSAFAWLAEKQGWDNHKIALWSESLIPPLSPQTQFKIPRDDDAQIPHGPDPLPQLVALRLAAIPVIYIRSGVDAYGSALQQHLVLMPQDALPLAGHPPVSLTLTGIVSTSVRMDQTVDAFNRPLTVNLDTDPAREPNTAVHWIVEEWKKPQE